MYPGLFATLTPDKPAVVMASGAQVTYRDLDDRSNRLAQLLYARGLRPGDQVAVWTENHARYFEAYWAAIRSGLYFTGVNRYATAEEAAYILEDSGAAALITSRAMAERAAELVPLAPGCRIRLMMDGTAPGYEGYEAALDEHPAEPLPEQPRGELMLYSSGTTGRPKGVRRELTGVDVSAPESARMGRVASGMLGMSAAAVYLIPAPLYHAAALQWSIAVQELGGTVVVMEKFDAELFLALIERHRITHTQVVPTMMVRMLKLPPDVRSRYDLSTLQSLVHAAAPCPVDVKRQMIEWIGPVVSEYYSGTEGNGMTYITAEEWLEHPGSVGRAIQGTIHICDDSGAELPPGEPGTLYFERDVVPFSYHKDAEKTRGALHPDHPTWSTLGDVGYVDEDGYLYLTDRKAFLIISGGVNVYPAEVEGCLVMHPKVADVAVFGLPDPEMGEYVQAVVQPVNVADAGDELAEELLTYARTHLSRYKIPRAIDFRDEVPRMATGKLQKGILRDEYLQTAR